MRRNNIVDMTIVEQITVVREKMCDDYCKYLDMANHGKMSRKMLEEECEGCPLRRL